jgi:hypothetical protein
MRALAVVMLLPLVAGADKLEDAAQLLIDRGLSAWEKGELTLARESFAGARDLQPHKPNPYRLLALIDSKTGRCTEAVAEIDLFLQLAVATDPRRAEAQDIRQSCGNLPQPAPPRPTAVKVMPPPAVEAPPPPKSYAWRNAAIASAVLGGALFSVGIALIAVGDNQTLTPGIAVGAVGGVGLALSIPLFIVNAR